MSKVLKFGALVIGVGLMAAASQSWVTQSGGVKAEASRKAMPPLVLSQLNGADWSLKDHRGEVVLINFWASWCPPCRQETPGLVKLANDYKAKGLAVVGVSMDEGGPGAVRAFVNEFHVPYAIGLPDPASAWSSAISSLPTTLLVDRQGRVAKTYMGAVRESVFEADVERLLNERGSSPKSLSL